jgi:type IV secretory pathway TrbF-like protein
MTPVLPFSENKNSGTQNSNPQEFYLNARREWDERFGGFIQREAFMKKLCIIMGIISILSVTGIAYIGSQSKLVPYIVQTDQLGLPIGVQRADVAQKPDARIIRAQLAEWITNARTISSDTKAQERYIKKVGAMIRNGSPAFTQMEQYLKANPPKERAKHELTSVQISSALPISDTTWQVQWLEQSYSLNTNPTINGAYIANITIEIIPPVSESTLLRNPTGVYIQNFNWQQRI